MSNDNGRPGDAGVGFAGHHKDFSFCPLWNTGATEEFHSAR